MRHFLLVYDRRSRQLIDEPQEYPDRGTALQARWAEDAKHRGDETVEVVVLSADSEEALRRTHGRYFKSVAELAS